MRTALAQHGFAMFAVLLFAATTALGVVAGQRWADRAALTHEPPSAVAPLDGVGGAGGAGGPAPAHEPPTAHPEWPVIATAERDGLRVELRLPTDTYLGGEVLQAEVGVRNVGRTTISLQETYLTLRDEQGRDVELGPASPAANWLNAMSRQNVRQDLAPGAGLRNTHWYRVPPEGAYGYHRYSAWATAFVSHEKQRPDGLTETGTTQGPEAGPLPLRITEPRYGQLLRAQFQADRQGWRLRVTEWEGRPLRGPLWGAMALGHWHDPSAIGPLVRLKDHPDPNVRYGVVFGLLGHEDDLAIRTLIELSADEDTQVRDWATFGLGSQVEADTPEIREVLVRRLADPDPDTRGEAMEGLAVRGDERVVEPLIAEIEAELDAAFVGTFEQEAVEAMDNPRLNATLARLKDNWDDEDRAWAEDLLHRRGWHRQ